MNRGSTLREVHWGVRLAGNVITGLALWGWLAWRKAPMALATAAVVTHMLVVIGELFNYVCDKAV